MRFKTTTYILVTAVVALLTMPARVLAQPAAKTHRNSITAFDVPGTGVQTIPIAINLGGLIAGYDLDENAVFHGFIRTPGGHITTFDAPGAGTTPFNGTLGTAINLVGVVTGQVCGDDTVCHGFIRTPGGHFTTFDAPGAVGFTTGAAINLFGQVAGYYQDGSLVAHSFLRAANGTFTIIDVPGAGTGPNEGTWMFYINTMTLDGSVSGFYVDADGLGHGWIRKGNGTIITFDAPGAGTDGSQGQGTYPITINELGEVGGGYVDAANIEHGFIRAADGTFTTVDVPGASNSGVDTLNDLGVAAGEFLDQTYTYHCFFRTPDGTITTVDVPGAENTREGGINDLGVITGFFAENGLLHGYVRYPHP